MILADCMDFVKKESAWLRPSSKKGAYRGDPPEDVRVVDEGAKEVDSLYCCRDARAISNVDHRGIVSSADHDVSTRAPRAPRFLQVNHC